MPRKKSGDNNYPSSGQPGIAYKDGKYSAALILHGVCYPLGNYDTEMEAILARNRAERKTAELFEDWWRSEYLNSKK